MAERADDKKKEEKPESKNLTPGELTTELVGVIIGIVLLARLLGIIGGPGLIQFFQGTVPGYFTGSETGLIAGKIASVSFVFSNILTVFFVLGIVYAGLRIVRIQNEWWKRIYPEEGAVDAEQPKNARWDQVITHIQSDNPSDWRLAILEADIGLDDLLDRLGYVGDTIGDKLKAVEPARFRTLDDAWEAHKIRNAIAHEGADFELTQREARRIIGLYEKVFREFDYI